jgi:hypothetical protein
MSTVRKLAVLYRTAIYESESVRLQLINLKDFASEVSYTHLELNLCVWNIT